MSELALTTVTTATFKKVGLKLLAEVLIDFSDGTFTLAKIIEVLVYNLPLLVFLETLLADVFQKVKRKEWKSYLEQVSEWELSRYLYRI